MAKPKMAVQLIIWGDRTRVDLDGVLREVADGGFDGIEMDQRLLAGMSDPNGYLAEHGLELAGFHLGGGDMSPVEEAMRLLQQCDAHYVLFSGVGDRSGDESAAYKRGAAFMNEVGKLCKGTGITPCYHNHNWEFKNDSLGMNILLAEIDPELAGFAFDVYWLSAGGEDPAAWIERYADRTAYVHFKDMAEGTFAPVGDGELDWPGIWRAVEPLGLPWVCAEQDRTDGDPGEASARSRAYLKKTLGI